MSMFVSFHVFVPGTSIRSTLKAIQSTNEFCDSPIHSEVTAAPVFEFTGLANCTFKLNVYKY